MKSTYKVAVIDDNLPLADLLREWVNNIIGFQCDQIFPNPLRFLAEAKETDIVLLDILMPEMNGLEAIEPIIDKFPAVAIIMNTQKDDTETIFEALKKGALGYIDKQSFNVNLEDVLKTIAKGGAYMTPAIAMKVFSSFREVRPSLETLSPREKDVTESILEGLTYNKIAEKYNISINTVRMNIKSTYKKLKINSKAQLFNLTRK